MRTQPADFVERRDHARREALVRRIVAEYLAARTVDEAWLFVTTDRNRPTNAAGASSRGAATGSGTSTGPISWLTLAVTQQQASRLAQARWAGQLDVALFGAR